MTKRYPLMDAARGLGAGLVATTVMSGAMWIAQRAGLLGEMPPKKIARKLHERVLGKRAPRSERALATLIHGAIGGGAGALYGLLSSRSLAKEAPNASGIAFGMLVWATGYLGLLPAAHVLPMPDKDRRGRPSSMIAAHVIYGAVLGNGVRALSP